MSLKAPGLKKFTEGYQKFAFLLDYLKFHFCFADFVGVACCSVLRVLEAFNLSF